MSILQPLACIRPQPELAARMATGPHSTLSREAIRNKVRENPLSYSRVVHPRALVGDVRDAYQQAAAFLQGWINEGKMLEDKEEAYYLYRLESGNHAQSGLVGRTPIDEILSGRIHAHEKIRESKLSDLACHIEACGVQIGGPILMAYRGCEEMNRWIRVREQQKPLYDFDSENGVHNQIWKIRDEEEIEWIRSTMSQCGDLYIADGHHRVTAAGDICRRLRRAHPDYTGREPWNYMACVCFADTELQILPYARVVSGLSSLSREKLLQGISRCFSVKTCGPERKPEKRGEFILCCQKERFLLTLDESCRPERQPDCLDVSVLQDKIIGPVLGIRNPRCDEHLDFVGGLQQEKQVEDLAAHAGTVGFLLYPTSMEELFAAADENAVMPPKSTWFEPKLCNGLFLYRIDALGEEPQTEER